MILAAFLIFAIDPAPARPTLDQVLDAIQCVETGGEPNGGRDAIGDGGRSVGPLQIQRAYWIDSGVTGRFEDCRDVQYARKVVKAYWKRWCPAALERVDSETLARIHQGGPRGMRRSSTLGYWRKVNGKLQRPAILTTKDVALVEWRALPSPWTHEFLGVGITLDGASGQGRRNLSAVS